MIVLDESKGRVILRRGDGALIFLDDEGFEVKNLPDCGKQIKTTDWDDWYAMNELINKISRGKPRRRS